MQNTSMGGDELSTLLKEHPHDASYKNGEHHDRTQKIEWRVSTRLSGLSCESDTPACEHPRCDQKRWRDQPCHEAICQANVPFSQIGSLRPITFCTRSKNEAVHGDYCRGDKPEWSHPLHAVFRRSNGLGFTGASRDAMKQGSGSRVNQRSASGATLS